jgi:hypothetical protein
MIKFPRQELIVQATLDGILKSSENFLFWTNGRLSLSHGPQKIITLHVANEIAKIDNTPEIFIDATVADILRCSLANRDGFVEHMKKSNLTQGIFSITLDERFKHENDDDSISRVIISVKNGVRNPKQEFINEIERICKMIDRQYCENSTLKYGIFAFYSDLSENARKKLDKRMPEVLKSFDAVVEKFSTLKATFVDSGIKNEKDGSQWLAGCYIIEPIS